MTFNTEEQEMILKAKDLESDAKMFRRMAQENRSKRLKAEEKERNDLTAKDQRDRVDFTDRIHAFVFNLNNALKINDMKIMDNSSFGVEKYKIVVVDNRSGLKADIWAVDGHGFQWSIR